MGNIKHIFLNHIVVTDKAETLRFSDTESHGNELGHSSTYPHPSHVEVVDNPNSSCYLPSKH